MKTNIGFFTHETDAPDNRKFLILRAYYGGILGWAMEARFWALNCLIGEADGCKLDTTKKGEKARIARSLELSLKELDDFIVVLRDEAELLKDENGVLWTQQTQDDLRRATEAREAAKKRYSKQKDTPHPEKVKTSPEVLNTSPEVVHGVEETREDKRRAASRDKSLSAAARAETPVDKSEEEAFRTWALEKAKAAKAARPTAYAKTILADPVALEEFREEQKPKPDGRTQFALEPPLCSCGGKIKALTHLGLGQCPACGEAWAYSWDFEIWSKSGSADTG